MAYDARRSTVPRIRDRFFETANLLLPVAMRRRLFGWRNLVKPMPVFPETGTGRFDQAAAISMS
jgi:hypothetical protein